jgi:AAA15 family ATPase/GTPase
MIQNLQINNYKSINDINLECSRINLLIGEPNVGKSNILEALDLSYLPSMLQSNELYKKSGNELIDIKRYFRVNKVSDLFTDGNISNPITILHPGYSVSTKLSFKNNIDTQKNFFEISAGTSFTLFNDDFFPLEPIQFFSSPIVPYRFKDNIDFHDTSNFMNHLMPLYGNNLLEVIKLNPDFRKLVSEMIQDFGSVLNIDSSSHKLLIQKEINPGIVYNMKYEALADTLRRMIFYIAVVRYNSRPVITLEEPDAHSFPKFVSFLADEIIQNNKNQFFIATHNPYLLNNLIENTPSNELSVFVCGFDKSKGTIVNKLSQSDLSELLDYGVDIFFNINKYLDDNIEYSA